MSNRGQMKIDSSSAFSNRRCTDGAKVENADKSFSFLDPRASSIVLD